MQTDRNSKMITLGIDIGSRFTKIGLFHPGGELLSKHVFPTGRHEDGGAFGAVADKIHELIARGFKPEDVAGIGICVPGNVSKGGVIINSSLADLKEVYPREVFRQLLPELDVPLLTINDANAVALGEMFKGAGKGREDIVCVTLGTGVGAGIISNGKIVTGYRGAAGEIGHMQVNNEETEACSCGRKGCLRQYASQPALVAATTKLLRDYPEVPSPLRAYIGSPDGFNLVQPPVPMTAKDIFEAAFNGDEIATLVVNRACSMIGKAVSFLADIAAPEAIIFGGELSHTGSMMIKRVRAAYQRYVFSELGNIPFKECVLGAEAGMYGCDYIIEEYVYGEEDI